MTNDITRFMGQRNMTQDMVLYGDTYKIKADHQTLILCLELKNKIMESEDELEQFACIDKMYEILLGAKQLKKIQGLGLSSEDYGKLAGYMLQISQQGGVQEEDTPIE